MKNSENTTEKKTKIHEFDVVLFPRKIWVTYNCPAAVLEDMFPLRKDERWEELDEATDAAVYTARRVKPDVKGGMLIRFKDKKDMTPEIIAHEAVHAAMGVLHYIDEMPDYNHQETLAYLVQLIVEFCNQVKNNKV